MRGKCCFQPSSVRVRVMEGVPVGTCHCGCGQSTTLGPGRRPRQYVHGHNRKGASSPEGWVEQGMRFIWVEGKKRPLHRLVMEAELGRSLRSDEVVRHRDGDVLNNDPDNLVIVSREEHFELSMASSEAKQPWAEEEKDEAVRLYCEGMTIDEVARALGRSYSAARRLLASLAVLRSPCATRALRTSSRQNLTRAPTRRRHSPAPGWPPSDRPR